MGKNPELPEGSYAVTAEDKVKMQELGRALTNFIHKFVAESGEKRFHSKIVVGAFNYFIDLQSQISQAVGNDLIISHAAFLVNGLGNEIEEPYTPEPEPEPLPIVKKGVDAADEALDASLPPSTHVPADVPQGDA